MNTHNDTIPATPNLDSPMVDLAHLSDEDQGLLLLYAAGKAAQRHTLQQAFGPIKKQEGTANG